MTRTSGAIRAMKSGASDYLIKPLDLDEMEGVIARCLAKRRSVDGVDAPILFYLDKMLKRARLLRTQRNSDSVAEIVDRMFGERLEKAFHVYLKASEVVFLLDFLDQPERLRSVL